MDIQKSDIVDALPLLTHNLSRTKQNIQSLNWYNLNFTIVKKTETQILFDSFGCCKAGTVTAIIGSSGAGKTTLLNLLAQRTTKASGRIEGTFGLDFKPLNNPKQVKNISAFCL
jgi:ATP-binding cassette, subfamily G (WHITE), member 2, SNQ2